MSIQRFNRNYKLTIDPKDGGSLIVIQPPFTCRFWMVRNILASLNQCSVDVYNLSLTNRRRIFQDRYDYSPVMNNGVDVGARTFKFEAGYGNLLYTLFSGTMQIASSAREGVNLITRIESLAGMSDVALSTINITLPAGVTLQEVFKTLIGKFTNTQYGFVSAFDQVFPRPVVLNGKPWELVQQYAQNGNTSNGTTTPIDAYIDNGKAYVMFRTDKLIVPTIPLISAATGLLETPRREQSSISVTTLLNTEIQVNTLCEIDSVIEPAYNGQYAVLGLQHSGTISEAVSGDCRSTFFVLDTKFGKYNLVQGL